MYVPTECQRHLPDPGRPPCYSSTFFNHNKDVKEKKPLNVAWVTVKQWYQLLLERESTHTSDNPDTPLVLINTRMEERNPSLDLSHSYRLSRVFGLAPEQKSFNFKIMQSLLRTRDSLARMRKIQSSNCIHCDGLTDSTEHLLQQAPELPASYFPSITPKNIVILMFRYFYFMSPQLCSQLYI